jgi:cytoskeletal protein RodZ
MATLLSDRSPAEATVHDRPRTAIETTVSLGLSLKRLRERRGLTREQLAAETKIPARRLEAIEQDAEVAAAEEFYRRAEIRVYARAVRYDERLAMAAFERMRQPPKVDVPAPERPRSRAATLFSPARGVIVVAVLMTAAMLGRAMRAPEPASQLPAAAQPVVQGPRTDTASLQPRASAPSLSAPTERSSALNVPPPASPPAVDAVPTAGSIAASDGRTALTANTLSELIVSTEPTGARVTVNGIGWGISPVTIRHLPPGTKRIRVTKDGFISEERVRHVNDGGSTMVDIRLTRIQ